MIISVQNLDYWIYKVIMKDVVKSWMILMMKRVVKIIR